MLVGGALALATSSLLLTTLSTLGGANGVAGAATTFTGSPITVGSTAAENTSQANFPGVPEVGTATVNQINAAGGIKTADGKTHKLVLDFCNNQATPNGSVTCANKFIGEHVVATVGIIDQNSNVADPLFTKAGIPNFANNPLTEWDLAGSDSYPIVGSASFTYAGLGLALGKAGFKAVRPAGLQEAAAAITPLFNTLKAALATKGSKMLSPVLFPGATTDYSPIAAQIMSGNPDAVVEITSPANGVPLSEAIVQAASGSKEPSFSNVAGSVTQQSISTTGGKKTIFNGSLITALYSSSNGSGWAGYRTALKKSAPNASPDDVDGYTGSPQNMYVGLYAFRTLISKLSGTITAAKFKTELDSTTNLTTGGLTPTINFTKTFPCGPFSRSFNTTYYSPVKIVNGEFVAQPGAKLSSSGSAVIQGFGSECKATASQLGVS